MKPSSILLPAAALLGTSTAFWPVILGGAAAVAAPGLIAGPVLTAIGYGAGGVGAATTAAAWQASIGNVVAPSVFATLQSAAAGGYGVAVVNGAVQAVGAAAVAGDVIREYGPRWWG